MQRRHALQIGLALAALPLGCGATTPEPKTAPLPTGPGAQTATLPSEPVATVPVDEPSEPIHDTLAATPEEPPKPSFARVIGKVGRNHGHLLTVSFADVQSGAEKSYEIAGTAGHAHTVTLTPDDMKSLLTGQIFRTKSTLGKQHAHRILVRCAPAADPPEWIPACEATFSGQDEHELILPAADLTTKLEKTYDVQGIAGHAHTLTLTPADFEKLAKGEGISIRTSRDPDDAHLHVVFIKVKRAKA